MALLPLPQLHQDFAFLELLPFRESDALNSCARPASPEHPLKNPRWKTQPHGSFLAGMVSPELPAGLIGAGGLWTWPRRASCAQLGWNLASPSSVWAVPAPAKGVGVSRGREHCRHAKKKKKKILLPLCKLKELIK